MSHFSSVDSSPDPSALVGSLDKSAVWLGAMKEYMATAMALAVPGGRVLDLGSGAGHDLALLAGRGLRPVGIDPSAVMVGESRRRLDGPVVALVRGDGHVLPFCAAAFDGCRIERVLQHVDEPARVVAEVARVVRPGGLVAIFEPDWTSWRFATDLSGAEAIGPVLHRPRQPDIGSRLEGLVEEQGFEVVDTVTEASVVRSIESVPVNVETGVRRAVADGLIDTDLAERWLTEQRERDRLGAFRLDHAKILVVARR